MLEIFVEADTGVPEAEVDDEPALTEFKAVDQSETVLRLYAWYCTQDGDLNWFSKIWDKLAWPKHDNEFTQEQARVPVRIIRKSFELSKLSDRASVELAVEEFRMMLSNKVEQEIASPATLNDPALSVISVRG